MKIKNLSNKKFNYLTAIKYMGRDKASYGMWLCRCDCGNFTVIREKDLISNHTKSCGCLQHKPHRIIHNKTNTRLYSIWKAMKRRCINKNNESYKHYGGRGITVCNEWLDKEKGFINFYNWAINNGYNEKLTIDRINNDGNYEPSNCRWATRKQQLNNRRCNNNIIFNNEKHTMSEWSEITNLPLSTIRGRIKMGWGIEKTLTTPKLK